MGTVVFFAIVVSFTSGTKYVTPSVSQSGIFSGSLISEISFVTS